MHPSPRLPHAVVTHDDGVLFRVQDSIFSGKLGTPLLELGKRQVHEPCKIKKRKRNKKRGAAR